MAVVRAEFFKSYHDLIEDKEFVEHRDYYKRSVHRFWKSFDKIQKLNLPPKTKAIDIGGGIMAVLLSKILGIHACVGDVNEGAAKDLAGLGIKFRLLDLMSDEAVPTEKFDLVILQEVIEHLPHPPYVIFERIKRFLNPNGILFLTTPNGSRVRNVLYMLAGRPILDNFRYPIRGEALGHQQEYILPQLVWQLEKAGMVAISAEQYDDGWQGASWIARVSHTIAKPANIFSHLRNGLMIAARPSDHPQHLLS